VYIIYYAVIITKDLYGKKDDAKTNEEVFDVSGMADAEESVTVEENDGGFSIGGNSYDTQVDAINGQNADGSTCYSDNTYGASEDSTYNPTSIATDGATMTNKDNEAEGMNGGSGYEKGKSESSFERLKAKMENELEETETYMSNPISSQELYTLMIMRDPKMKWEVIKNEL
jgi:hypothetical protein